MALSRRRLLLGALAPARPNIVFILTDDQRWDALSAAGHPFLKTPHLDRLAREGAWFRHAFVTTPLCSPSRASFLTGRYAHAHGVTGNRDSSELSHRLVTFPRLLHQAGYETAYIGKWHMGTDDTPRPGFDRWVSFRGQGAYNDPALNIDGMRTKAEGYMTDLLSGHAVEFLRRPRARPFCLYLAHKAVHGPFTPAQRHQALFAEQPVQRSRNAGDDLKDKPALTRVVDGKPAVTAGGGSGDDLIRNQLRCLTAVDDGVGQVLTALEETGHLENTALFFTSDNGYFWGEHGLGDKRWAYEESIRIPLLVRYPRLVSKGLKPDGLALNVDLAPTVLDLADVPAPAAMQGRSLVPLLRGRDAGWRHDFLAEYFAEPNFPRTPTWHAVRTERWKFVRYPGLEGSDELYDIKKDPYEMENLIRDTGAAKVRRQLDERLETLRTVR